ncbi:Cupredoxin [Syncephalis fuscata]|nr:Cupredoxin [Syncephalis fuscata]
MFTRQFVLNTIQLWQLCTSAFVGATPSLYGHESPIQLRALDKTATTLVDSCQPPSCTVRRYYIAAEEILWDYAPSGQDMIQNRIFPDIVAALKQIERRTYKKAVYRGYEDATFKKRTPREEWLGILGPTIRAEVGDVIEILFRNMAKEAYSIHPHGVFYTPENEGALYVDATEGAGVRPGQTFTYQWKVPERAGPASDDPGSILWLYHSHHNEVKDVNAGLTGSIVIYRRGWLQSTEEAPSVLNATAAQLDKIKQSPWIAPAPTYPDISPDTYPRASTRYYARDTDREFIIWLDILNENNTPYYFENMQLVQEGALIPQDGSADADAPGIDINQLRRHQFFAINGRIFGNLAGLVAQKGERVRWHLAALGTEDALHHIQWSGPASAVTERGYRKNGASLLPASFHTVDSYMDITGRWFFECQTSEHFLRGMSAWYEVIARSANTKDEQTPNATGIVNNLTSIQDQFVLDAKIDAAIQSGNWNAMTTPLAVPSLPSMSTASWIMLIGVAICWLHL